MSKHVYLVGVDGSEWSERALERAVDLAKQTGADLELAFVIGWSILEPVFVDGGNVVPELKFDEEERAKREIVDPLVSKYKDSGVNISVEYHWGDAAHILHKMSKRKHANMVFVGRKGRSRIADLFMGSVANKLAHTIGVPLVLVP